MLNEEQIYIASTDKDFLSLQLGNSVNLSPVGTFEIAKVSENKWITGDSIADYAYTMSRQSSSNTIAVDNWAITLNDNKEFSLLYSGQGASSTELFCSGLNVDGNDDIYMPSRWTAFDSSRVDIDINDRYFQGEIFNNGKSNLSYKITKDINVSYSDNIRRAQGLNYETVRGWEVDFKEGGEFSYYLQREGETDIDPEFVWTDIGPIVYISQNFLESFLKIKDPEFNFDGVSQFLFKKGRHISGQSFSDRDYDSAPIIQPTGGAGQLDFGDPSWFINEGYILNSIPSTGLFAQQEVLTIAERNGEHVPSQEELINLEADESLLLTPITGQYYFNDQHSCGYAKKFFKVDEARHWREDLIAGVGSYRNYLTASNFIYNVIKHIDENGININGSPLDRFLSVKLGAQYRDKKLIADFIKDAKRPKIGFNEGCNVFRRAFFYYGGSNAYVEWSLNHGMPNDDRKIHTPAIRRIYELDYEFSYKGKTYSVVDFAPFEDFGMEPIKWIK